jgi:enterochelin esterase-like enzyme
VRLFLAAGDDGDLDQEATTMHRRAEAVTGISSRLRILPGGHDWDVWEPAFAEGLPFVLGATVGSRS